MLAVELFDVERRRCSRTRSRRGCTTPGTGRSRARRRASSRTTCARCSAGRSARPRARGAPRWSTASARCRDRDAVLAVPGAHLHDYGKSPRPGPQGRPRDRGRRRRGRRSTTRARLVARDRAAARSADARPLMRDRADVAELGDLVGARSPTRRAPRRCARPAWRGRCDRTSGVRENRGAGAGCGTPSYSMIVPRALMCGCSAASVIVQHRREARVGAFEQLAPLGARLRREQRGEALPQRLGQPSRSICAGRSSLVEPECGAAAPRRTAARASRARCTCRRRSRTCRRTARRCRARSCPSVLVPNAPIARRPQIIVISIAAPSTIAASTT